MNHDSKFETKQDIVKFYSDLRKKRKEAEKAAKVGKRYLQECVEKIDPLSFEKVYNDIDFVHFHTIKKEFGKLFYGSLVPINGSSSENKRFSDGDNHIFSQDDAPPGPAVWKKIGKKEKHMKRVNWANENEVFDTLTDEHADLVINGTRNRFDQKEVILDFLKAKKAIEKYLVSEEEDIVINLSKPYSLLTILSSSSIADFSDSSFKILETILNKVTLRANYLNIFPTIKEEDLQDAGLYSYSTYGEKSPVSLSLFKKPSDRIVQEIKGQLFLGAYFYLLNVNDIIKDPAIEEHFNRVTKNYQKGIDIFNSLVRKYSTRLLIKGTF